MKITKYEHACLDFEINNRHLVIDPGDFSKSLPISKNIDAVIVTHIHFDHLNVKMIDKIKAANPKVQIYSVPEAAEKLGQFNAVLAGDKVSVGPYSLEFFGKTHAVIHPEYPEYQNVGVLINNSVYYGGDSLITPSVKVKILAVPVSGPWLKTTEVLNYTTEISPELVFPTHDSLNSDAGNSSQDRWFDIHSKSHGFKYQRLNIGQSMTV